MANKYEISTLANDIGSIVVSRTKPLKPLLSDELAYTLGACYDVKVLEDRYRPSVVETFESYMSSGDLFNMLTKWCPDKLPALVRDAMAARSRIQQKLETKIQEQKEKLEQEDDMIQGLVRHCKTALDNCKDLIDVMKTTQGAFSAASGFFDSGKGKNVEAALANGINAAENYFEDQNRRFPYDRDHEPYYDDGFLARNYW